MEKGIDHSLYIKPFNTINNSPNIFLSIVFNGFQSVSEIMQENIVLFTMCCVENKLF